MQSGPMSDYQFLSLIEDTCDEGLRRCRSWERKHKSRPCVQTDIESLLAEARRRLSGCKEPAFEQLQLVDVVELDRFKETFKPFLPAALRG